MKFIKKYYGLIGLLLSLISTFYLLLKVDWLVSFNWIFLFIFNSFFVVGIILLFDWISYSLERKSFLSIFFKKGFSLNYLLRILIIGFIFGFSLELYLHWLGKYWYYPSWSNLFYFLIFIPGFGGYVIYLVETYLGARAILFHIFGKREHKDKNFPGLMKLILLVFGLAFVISNIYLIFMTPNKGIWNFFSVNFQSPNPNNLVPVFISSAYFCILLDFFVHLRTKRSIIFNFASGDILQFAAILIAGYFFGPVWELFNAKGLFWHYANVPLSVTIFNIPLLVYLFWPAHYFPAIALYNLFFKEE